MKDVHVSIIHLLTYSYHLMAKGQGGRKKGSKDRPGHNAGGKRAGAGAKVKLTPREQMQHQLLLRTATMIW